MKHKYKAFLSLFSLTMGGILLLSGCSLLPLPDRLRYQRINNVVEQIDYKKSGDVLEERYDTGDGVFSPSFFLVKLHGEIETYESLKADILKIKDVDCPTNDPVRQVRCRLGQVDIYLNFNTSESPPHIILKVTDVYSGREAK